MVTSTIIVTTVATSVTIMIASCYYSNDHDRRCSLMLQMAAQMRQLEGRLMALREELREKESKARQAEHSVQDLKLQLEDLHVCPSSSHH